MKRIAGLMGIVLMAGMAMPALGDGVQPAAGSFASNTGGLPTLSQVNGTKAKVHVKHVGCGEDCWTHGLSKPNGNLTLTVKMGFACPAGDAVDQIYYSVGGGATIFAYQYGGGLKQQSKIVAADIQPWTVAMFEGAAISALGPSWSGGKDNHHNTNNTAKIGMHQTVEVFGTCQENPATRHKAFKVNTMATIIDQE